MKVHWRRMTITCVHEKMLALHKSLKSTQGTDCLTCEVESVDKSVDGLVYESCGLTEDEK